MPEIVSDDALPDSPCRRQCCLDGELCVGCFRMLDEIVGWSEMDAAARRQVLAQCGARRIEYRKRYPGLT